MWKTTENTWGGGISQLKMINLEQTSKEIKSGNV